MPDVPVFVIDARDVLAPRAIEAYQMLCFEQGLYDQAEQGLYDQAEQVGRALTEIHRWQGENLELLKTPDHPGLPLKTRTAGG